MRVKFVWRRESSWYEKINWQENILTVPIVYFLNIMIKASFLQKMDVFSHNRYFLSLMPSKCKYPGLSQLQWETWKMFDNRPVLGGTRRGRGGVRWRFWDKFPRKGGFSRFTILLLASEPICSAPVLQAFPFWLLFFESYKGILNALTTFLFYFSLIARLLFTLGFCFLSAKRILLLLLHFCRSFLSIFCLQKACFWYFHEPVSFHDGKHCQRWSQVTTSTTTVKYFQKSCISYKI